MKRGRILFCLVILAVLVLSGCAMKTMDQLYQIPQRSEDFLNLQTAVNKAMSGLSYSAPISGDHCQTVQMMDLDGDGDMECLLFAKGNDEKPLKIFIFNKEEDEYVLRATIESNGKAFEQVQYVQFDDRPGYELVVGRQVSDQVLRSVSVYSFSQGRVEQLMSASYTQIVVCDLNDNDRDEVLVLRPGDDTTLNGVAELYSMSGGTVQRHNEASMSQPPENIKRIMVSYLQGGEPAVYIASDVNGSAIITDVFTEVGGVFQNVSLSLEHGTSVDTLRNYYVYATDIDEDGVPELPELIQVGLVGGNSADSQYMIRWFSMNAAGETVEKMYTYHNFLGGWYLDIDTWAVEQLRVTQRGNSYEFSVVDGANETKVLTIYALTGQQREEMALRDNRFVLYRTESTVYAAHLEVASADYNMTMESLVQQFHLIQKDWNNGGT